MKSLLEAVIESGPYATNAILLIATSLKIQAESQVPGCQYFPEIGEEGTVAKFVTVDMRTLFFLR